VKNTVILVLILLIVSTCTNNDKDDYGNNGLLGKWRLIEQLIDPGDGSGMFMPISSERTLEFFNDDTVVVNGDLCFMASEVGKQSSGIFSTLVNNDYYDGEILPIGCDNTETKVYYKTEGVNLILWFQCIEGCGQKFIKVN